VAVYLDVARGGHLHLVELELQSHHC
jgi:hypothetical protein